MHPKPRNDALVLSLLWFAFGLSATSATDAMAAEMLPETASKACSDETPAPSSSEDTAPPSEPPVATRRSHVTRTGGNSAQPSRSSRWNAFLPGMLR
ncbi:MAG: hypothetical protein R3F04_04860 [Lysobacteraceae bacterium]